MKKEKVPFSESMLYPIIFMLILSVVFVGALAVLYRFSEAKITKDREDSYRKLILSLCADAIEKAFGQSQEQIMEAYPESFTKYIQEQEIEGSDRPAFVVMKDELVLVRCVDIPGKGLWGSMRALVALDDSYTQVQSISIYDQMETPGLGSRISEPWFQDQFQHMDLIKDGKFVKLEFIPEKQAAEEGQINKVTGATITSSAVVSMLRVQLQKLYDLNTEGDIR